VTILNQDFLAFDPAEHGLRSLHLVGNLPYNITSPVIDWCLRYRERMVSAVLMVQEELAARLSAQPGSRDWGPLALLTQLDYMVERFFAVSPNHFKPPPKVTSRVVRLVPSNTRVSHRTALEQVVRWSFGNRRKLLINNLSKVLSINPERLRGLLTEIKLDPKVRAEQVTTEQFVQLTALLDQQGLISKLSK
jgi:16S rRNA (adenine1518-N6/adenine1519-N6)-dimethyltransferase